MKKTFLSVSILLVAMGAIGSAALLSVPQGVLAQGIVSQGISAGQSCTTGGSAYSTCDTTLSWPQTWPDGNYTPVCSGVGPSIASLRLNVVSWTPSTVTVRLSNGSADGAYPASYDGINCVGSYAAASLKTLTAGQTCTTGGSAYSSCNTTVYWPTGWPNSSYVPVCSGVSPSVSSAKLNVVGWNSSGVTVNVSNGAANGAQAVSFGGVTCVGSYPTVNVKTISAGQTCTTGGGSYDSCDTTLNWSSSWPDSNYDPVCSGVSPSNGSAKLNIVRWNPSSVTVRVSNGTANGAQASWFSGVSCVGFSQPPAATFVSTNIPSLFNPGEKKTTGVDGQPLNIVMRNTGGNSWVADQKAQAGGSTGTCDSTYLGYPAPSTADDSPTSCSTPYTFSSSIFQLQHITSNFSQNPGSGLTFYIPSRVTVTLVPMQQFGDCAAGWNFVPTAYASKVGPPCVIFPAKRYITYSAPTSIAPGGTAQFQMNSLQAPGSGTTYNETWEMSQSGTLFQQPYTQTINLNAPVNGSCGTANGHVYASSDSGWAPYTFCGAGSVSPASPSFPSQGGSTSWSCLGSNGGGNASCSASRNSAVPGSAYVQSENSQYRTTLVTSTWAIQGQSGYFQTATCQKTATYNGVPAGGATVVPNPDNTCTYNYALRSITQYPTLALNSNWLDEIIHVANAEFQCTGSDSTGTCTILNSSNSGAILPSQTTSFFILWDPVATLTTNPSSLTLNASSSNPNPNGQLAVVNGGAPGSSVSWIASSPSYSANSGSITWLSLSGTSGTLSNGATGNASQTISIAVNSQGLPNGTYTATVGVTGSRQPNGVRPTASFTITLNVSGSLAGGPVKLTVNGVTTNWVGDPFSLSCSGGTGWGYHWGSQDSPSPSTASANNSPSYDPAYATPGSYQVTCYDSNNSSSTKTLTVIGPSCQSFTANPTLIIPPESSALSWRCTNTTSCSINGTSLSNPLSGTMSVSPTSDTTYTLSCSGDGSGSTNNVSLSTQVKVQGPGVIEVNP